MSEQMEQLTMPRKPKRAGAGKRIEAVKAWGIQCMDNGGCNLSMFACPSRDGAVLKIAKMEALVGSLNDKPVLVRILRESDYRKLLKASPKPRRKMRKVTND